MKRGLQITLFLLSLIHLAGVLQNFLLGAGRYLPVEQIVPALDSQIRFLAALHFGIVMLIWWMIPNIERHIGLFRIVAIAMFAGGTARILSYVLVGAPPGGFFIAAALELAMPLLALWQSRLARADARPSEAE